MSSWDRDLGRGGALDHGSAESEEPDSERALGERRRGVAMHRRWVQRKASGGAANGARIPGGSGAPLGNDVRTGMERHLGADLSNARIHTGADSAQAAESFGARAFTVGSDVHFGAGEFAPGSVEGDRLLAHELTHVVQGQRSGIKRKAKEEGEGGEKEGADGEKGGADGEKGGEAGEKGGEGEVSQPGDAAEKEADAVGDHVADEKHGKDKDKGKDKKDKDKKDKGKDKGKDGEGKGKEGEGDGKEGEGADGADGKEGEGKEGAGGDAKGEKGAEKGDAKGEKGDAKGEKGDAKGGAPEAKEAAPAVGAKLAPGAAGKIFLAPKPNAAPKAAGAAPKGAAPAGGAPGAPGAAPAKSPEESNAEKVCTDAKKAMAAGVDTDPGYKSLLQHWSEQVKPFADKFGDKNAVIKDAATALQKKSTDHEALCTQVMGEAASQIAAFPMAPESKAAEWAIWTAQKNQAWYANYTDNAAVKTFKSNHDKKVEELRGAHDKKVKEALSKIKGVPDLPDPKNPKDDPRKAVDGPFEEAKPWLGKQIGDPTAEDALQLAYANKLESIAAAKEKAAKEKEEKQKADKEKADQEKAGGDKKGGGAPGAAAGGAPKEAAGGHDAAGGGAPKEAAGAPPAADTKPAGGDAGGEHKPPGGEHPAPAADHAAKPAGAEAAHGAHGGGDKKHEEEEKKHQEEEAKELEEKRIENEKEQLEVQIQLLCQQSLQHIAEVNAGLGAAILVGELAVPPAAPLLHLVSIFKSLGAAGVATKKEYDEKWLSCAIQHMPPETIKETLQFLGEQGRSFGELKDHIKEIIKQLDKAKAVAADMKKKKTAPQTPADKQAADDKKGAGLPADSKASPRGQAAAGAAKGEGAEVGMELGEPVIKALAEHAAEHGATLLESMGTTLEQCLPVLAEGVATAKVMIIGTKIEDLQRRKDELETEAAKMGATFPGGPAAAPKPPK